MIISRNKRSVHWNPQEHRNKYVTKTNVSLISTIDLTEAIFMHTWVHRPIIHAALALCHEYGNTWQWHSHAPKAVKSRAPLTIRSSHRTYAIYLFKLYPTVLMIHRTRPAPKICMYALHSAQTTGEAIRLIDLHDAIVRFRVRYNANSIRDVDSEFKLSGARVDAGVCPTMRPRVADLYFRFRFGCTWAEYPNRKFASDPTSHATLVDFGTGALWKMHPGDFSGYKYQPMPTTKHHQFTKFSSSFSKPPTKPKTSKCSPKW